jgi:hypothetical protein
MLWYKAWLETRWRFVFTAGSMALVWLTVPFLGAPPERLWVSLELAAALLGCFAAIFLAGAGINTQTLYSGTTGYHGSMLYTLSLPVSRRRLFAVRAGLGAVETCAIVAVTAGVTLLFRPETTSASQALRYGLRAIVCTMAVYALSVMLACVLDEMWQFTGACLCLGAVLLMQFRWSAAARFSPLRGMNLLSYPVTAPMPWAPVIASIVCTGILLYASVLVLQRKEY